MDCIPFLYLRYCAFAIMGSNRYNVIGIDWWYMGSAGVQGENRTVVSKGSGKSALWNKPLDPTFTNTLEAKPSRPMAASTTPPIKNRDDQFNVSAAVSIAVYASSSCTSIPYHPTKIYSSAPHTMKPSSPVSYLLHISIHHQIPFSTFRVVSREVRYS